MSSKTPERIHFAAVDPATGGEDAIVSGFAEGGIVHLDRSRAPYETLATVRKRLERRYDRAPNGCRDCGAEQRGHGDDHPYVEPGDELRLARMKHRRDIRLNPPRPVRPTTDLVMTFTIDTSAYSAAMGRVVEAMLPLVEAERARQDAITVGALLPDRPSASLAPYDLITHAVVHPPRCRCSILPLGAQVDLARAVELASTDDPELDAARHWPAPSRAVCAHVCGPDAGHSCEARATTSLRFTLPSGGVRDLPLCAACTRAEDSATGAAY